jgi:hypothetical protein
LEFLDEDSEPAREIGLGSKGTVIFWTSPDIKKQSKPWNGKAGFMDPQMSFRDFQDEFRCTDLEESDFEKFWKKRNIED